MNRTLKTGLSRHFLSKSVEKGGLGQEGPFVAVADSSVLCVLPPEALDGPAPQPPMGVLGAPGEYRFWMQDSDEQGYREAQVSCLSH